MQLSESNTIVCNAPRDEVYRIIRDSARWPEIFEPCQAVRHLSHSAYDEHIEVTALVNGEAMTWESKRAFQPAIHGINSVVVKPMKLVSRMETSWRVVALNHAQCLLVLEHTFGIVDEPAGLVDGVSTQSEAEAFMRRAIHTNSTKELGNIKQVAERLRPATQTPLEFVTSHAIVCEAPAQRVYKVLVNVGNWPQIIEACTAARSMSPVESCGIPCFSASLTAWVPLPAPGGPSRMSFISDGSPSAWSCVPALHTDGQADGHEPGPACPSRRSP